MRILAALLAIAACTAADTAAIGDFEVWQENWIVGLGPEFPGAKAEAELASPAKVGSRCLSLAVDFAGGGGYVQVARKFDGLPLKAFAGWMRSDGVQEIRYRIVDSTGQVFQSQHFQVRPGNQWARFSVTVDELTHAEHWDGAKDGAWHGPCKYLAIMVPKNKLAANRTAATIAFDGLEATLEANAKFPADAPAKLVAIDPLDAGPDGWSFTNGPEFPGAKGAMVHEGKGGKSRGCLRMDGDFSGGGSYVAVTRKLAENGPDVRELRLWIKRTGVDNIGLRLIDNSGQCHQKQGGLSLKPGDGWQEVALQIDEILGGEHWGGANDGLWHPPLQGLSILIGADKAAGGKPTLWIDEIRGVAITERKR